MEGKSSMTHTIADHNAAQSEYFRKCDEHVTVDAPPPKDLSIDDYYLDQYSGWGATAVHHDFTGDRDPAWMSLDGKNFSDIRDQIAEIVENDA